MTEQPNSRMGKRYSVHFPEQTILIEPCDDCYDRDAAEFVASNRVIADKVEDEL